MKIELTWPPSNNVYYRKTPKGMRISDKGKSYRKYVWAKAMEEGWEKFGLSRIRMVIHAHEPDDHRDRDLDNILKAVFDSLEKAGIYRNDKQIDDLHVKRAQRSSPGRLEIELTAL